MGKKRDREADEAPLSKTEKDPNRMDEDSSDDEDFDVVNVEFEWFNFDADIDFHGTKTLLRQLFDVDSTLHDVSGLADLILGQPTIGSTIKVDGKENDAYAFLTALNVREHRDKKPLADLAEYLSTKAKAKDSLAPIAPLLAPSSNAEVGLVFSERLINMPAEIAPPMYTMLIDEIEAAVEDNEPYKFTHYLILSKAYQEVESTLDVETERRKKKAKEEASTYYFHPEDEVLLKHALAHGSFPFTKDDETVADSKRAFQEMGVKSHGYMILIEASRFPDSVKAITEYLRAPTA